MPNRFWRMPVSPEMDTLQRQIRGDQAFLARQQAKHGAVISNSGQDSGVELAWMKSGQAPDSGNQRFFGNGHRAVNIRWKREIRANLPGEADEVAGPTEELLSFKPSCLSCHVLPKSHSRVTGPCGLVLSPRLSNAASVDTREPTLLPFASVPLAFGRTKCCIRLGLQRNEVPVISGSGRTGCRK